MKRATVLVVVAVLLCFAGGSPVQAGGGFGAAFLTGKISGPSIAATIVVDPTHISPAPPNSPDVNVNPEKGRITVALTLKGASSAAIFTHLQASGWVLGCDGQKGALQPDPNFNVSTLTSVRFFNQPLSNWMPPGIINELLFASAADGGLGLAPTTLVPGITAIGNPVCTTVVEKGLTRYVLSFSATVQFAQGAQ